MTVLFICDEYPPGNNGGIGTTVQNLGRELVQQGHQVLVAGLYAYRYKEKDYEEDQGVRVWRKRYGLNLHLPSRSKWYTALERLPDPMKKRLNGQRAFRAFVDFIRELISTHRVDVIEIADFNSFAMYIGFKVEWPLFDVPLVLKSHGSYTYFCRELGEVPHPKFEAIDKALYARADAYSCVSHYTATANERLFGLQRPMKVLYNGIHVPAEASSQREAFSVVFSGTLVYKKGIFSLIKAWNAVHSRYPKARLFVYGKGSHTRLKKLLSPESAASVEFAGHVSRPDLLDKLKTATLAVFPSYSETFGMGVVEAMSMGCPVIYTKRSCGPEIVKQGIEGLLVDPDQPGEITQAISQLFDSAELRDRLAQQAYQGVQNRFRIDHSAKDHVQFYSDVIQEFKLKKATHR